jgi:ferredoxin
VPECPVNAIFHETNVPAQWAQFVKLNADRVLALKEIGGNITERQQAKEGKDCRGRP